MRVALLKPGCWREWCWCVAWPLRGRSCVRYASIRESGSIRQLSLQSKFLPSFRERYSPPNPESASIGRNLGWRNCTYVHISVTKWGIVGYETGALWDLCNRSIVTGPYWWLTNAGSGCSTATSHYLSQCWPRSISPVVISRPQWVNC